MPTMIERLRAQDKLVSEAEERLALARARLTDARRYGQSSADLERSVALGERLVLVLNDGARHPGTDRA
jgi:hypothetical protein